MPTTQKGFSGVMNLDDNNDVIPQSHHKDAKNVVFRGNGINQIVQNIYGNRKITNTLQAGTNICIGSYYDQLKQRLFYFIYNSNGKDGIYMYNTVAGTITPLLISLVNSSEALFSFNPDYPIASVNILYRTDDDGDVLHWTDGLNRPMKLNIKDATGSPNLYGSLWKNEYLTVARKVPLISPLCKYANDTSIGINNLKNRVFQFCYRWVYKDGTKSTFSPWSRLFAPADVDTLATEINPTKNNKIQVDCYSGGADVYKIEITARQSIVNTFSDSFLVAVLDKTVLGYVNDNIFTYNFYNSESYPFVNVNETTILFSYVPAKANAQELLNGNQIIYGGITEGKTFDTTLSVSATQELVINTPPTNPFTAITQNWYAGGRPPTGDYYYYLFDGLPQVGDSYSVVSILGMSPGSSTTVTTSLVIGAGENSLAGLETKMFNRLTVDATFGTYGLTSYITKLNGSGDTRYPGRYGIRIGTNLSVHSFIVTASMNVVAYAGGGLPPDPTGVNTACFKHNSKYSFGICYFDKYGVTNGVNVTNNMNINTPEIASTDLGGTPLTIPSITFNVSNAPPSWAESFSFVRTSNLTLNTLKTIISDTTLKDSGGTPAYAYLNITSYQVNTINTTAYDFVKGDRIRIVGRKNNSVVLNAYSVVNNYPIIDLLENPTINSVAQTGTFIKVQYDGGVMGNFGTAGYNNYYIEVYTPSQNTIASDTQVYYEFGETYFISTDINGNRIHTGKTQNQIIGSGSQPAIFQFFRGDMYSRYRESVSILDKSMSDLYSSEVDGLGRPLIQDSYAKETYYPTLVRYSLNYQQGTQINDTNMFYVANYDEYDRQKGDIRRLKVRGNQIRVFQSRGCGVVGVLENMIFNANGSENLIQTDTIINKIHYYQGEYGVGWMNTSLTSSANADYFVDPVRGYQVRLSQDGITPISELDKGQCYISNLSKKYISPVAGTLGGKAKVLGIFDFYEEQYVSIFQAFSGQSNTTIAFNENKNAYSSFYDYAPEWVSSVDSSVVSFKAGELYLHDNTTNYNTFYGVSYPSSITLVYNINPIIKKDFNTITQDTLSPWISSGASDINTSLGQISNLVTSDYEINEGFYHAAFLKDGNSIGGVIEGDYLKGSWLQSKLSNSSTNFVYLSGVYVNFTVSQRNA